jgi:hypothetical protein
MMRASVFFGAALAGSLLAGLAAGCTGHAGSPAAAGASPAASVTAPATATASPAASPTGSFEQQALAWGRRFAQCARDHGLTNFPDPVYHADYEDNDGIEFPMSDPIADKQTQARAGELCADLIAQMPPRPITDHPHDAQRLVEMRAYAACMRQHGVGDFPDPTAYGTFPVLGTRLKVFAPGYIGNLPPDLARAYDACWDKQANWRMASLLS